MWLDPTLRRRHRPTLEFAGEELGYYFPPDNATPHGHTRVGIMSDDNQTIGNVVIKVPPDRLSEISGGKIDIVVSRDYRPAVVASALKAAHLTLFRMLGYGHVFSPGGIELSHILKTYFLECVGMSPEERRAKMATFFLPFAPMVHPIVEWDPTKLRGTVTDNLAFVCEGQSGKFWALGVLIRVGADMLCVLTPTDDGRAIDTYYGFLAEPPNSIAIRWIQFHPGDDSEGARWSMAAKATRVVIPSRQ